MVYLEWMEWQNAGSARFALEEAMSWAVQLWFYSVNEGVEWRKMERGWVVRKFVIMVVKWE